MDYEEFKSICRINKIAMQDIASEIGMTQDGLKKGLISGGLGIRYVLPLCNSLGMSPNRFFGREESPHTSQTQNGGVGNTQIMESGMATLQDQLREKDAQIDRLLTLLEKK